MRTAGKYGAVNFYSPSLFLSKAVKYYYMTQKKNYDKAIN
jgi:hypothetical protein